MDNLTKHQSNLSLNDREGGKMCLKKERSSNEHTIAKFLSKRALNTDVIVRTFSPLWHSINGFKVLNVGDHKILFVFYNNEEVEKILASEPWSFDRHLVVLQRLEIASLVRGLAFNKVSIWVQVHNILISYLNRSVAEELCEVIGEMDRTSTNAEVEGGSFIKVRVRVNVSLPQCAGLVLSIEDGKEGWVSFKYERLSNICYWCGCLYHANRDCDLWIESDGTLDISDQ